MITRAAQGASSCQQGKQWLERGQQQAGPSLAVTLGRGMWGQGGEVLHLQACNPLLFPTSLTKRDSSTAFRSLLIKSSLLLLGTYYISGLRDAQINKPQGPQGLMAAVVGNPSQENVTVLYNDGAKTRGPWGGDAEKTGQSWQPLPPRKDSLKLFLGEFLDSGSFPKGKWGVE